MTGPSLEFIPQKQPNEFFGLIKEKIIYNAISKGEKLVKEIIEMEINHLVSINKGYIFDRIVSQKEMSDNSIIIAIALVPAEFDKAPKK